MFSLKQAYLGAGGVNGKEKNDNSKIWGFIDIQFTQHTQIQLIEFIIHSLYKATYFGFLWGM